MRVLSEWKCLTAIAPSHFTIVYWASGWEVAGFIGSQISELKWASLLFSVRREISVSSRTLGLWNWTVNGWNFRLFAERWTGSTCRRQKELNMWWTERSRLWSILLLVTNAPAPVLAMQLTLANEMWKRVTCLSRQKLLRASLCFATLFPAEKMTTTYNVPDRKCSRSLGPGRKKKCCQAIAITPWTRSMSEK